MTDKPAREIDFNLVLKGINGDAIKSSANEDLRLGNVCVNALTMPIEADKPNGAKQLKKFKLALKIKGEDDDVFPTMPLLSEQIKLICDCVLACYPSPVMYGRVYEALEGTLEEG